MESFEIRKVVKVFLASPGDVPEERVCAKQVVDDLAGPYRVLGWQIELRGWEDVPPAYGRPQELINPEVDTCDLFVGILWKSLGSDAGKGSTGFEEEMKVALKRRKEGLSPEICLFVKDIEQCFLDDPGDKLKKVLAFLEKTRKKREVLYERFRDTREFTRVLNKSILNYINNLINRLSARYSDSKANSALPAPPTSVHLALTASPSMQLALTEQEKTREPGYAQLHDLLGRLSSAVENAIKPDGSGMSRSNLDDISRMHLLSSSMLASRNRAGFMGIHESNYLYRSRKQLRLISVERDYVLRTILADAHSSKPGWALLHEVAPPFNSGELFYFAAWDSDPGARLGALTILADSQIEFADDQEQRRAYLQTILSDNEPRSKQPAIKLASRIGKVEDIPDLDDRIAASQEESVRNNWLRAKLMILSPTRPAEAFRIVINHGLKKKEEREIFNLLNIYIKTIPHEILRTAVSANDTAAQELAVLELLSRGDLNDQDLVNLSELPSSDIQEPVVRERIRRGHHIDLDKLNLDFNLKKSLELEIFSPGSAEDLMEAVSWYDYDSKIAYRTLAYHYFDNWAPYLRRDLADDFQTYIENSKNRYTEYWKSKLGDSPEVLTAINESIFKLNDSRYVALRKDDLAQIALEALAQHPDSGDLEIAKKYLANSTSFRQGVRLASAEILSKVGGPSDAECIFGVMASTHGKTKQKLSQIALSLSPGIEGIAEQFINSGDPDLIEAAVAALIPRDGPAIRLNFNGKLSDPDSRIRLAAVSYFAQVCEPKELEQLLDDYIMQLSYYYNVVTWFDRLLWAPSQIIDYYRRVLTESVERQRSWSVLDWDE